MEHTPELVVMLTMNDRTLADAEALFEQAKDSRARCWGFKEKPLPPDAMKRLSRRMKECGKTVFFEVVEYTEPECLAGAEAGFEIGCDVLMGTVFFDSVNEFCKSHNMKYMPFVGKVTERPSILNGSPEDMIREARSCIAAGAHGIDLLGYRFQGDCRALIEKFVSEVDAPVCVAGSVNGTQRLDELKAAGPWTFTIGTSFFDGSFGGSLREQIDFVCDYMER